jgi:hypothetical protein
VLCGLQIAIQIAIPIAPLQRIRLRVSDRHKRHLPAHDIQNARVNLRDEFANGERAVNFVAMYRAGDDEFFAGLRGRIRGGFEGEKLHERFAKYLRRNYGVFRGKSLEIAPQVHYGAHGK